MRVSLIPEEETCVLSVTRKYGQAVVVGSMRSIVMSM